MFCKYCGTKTEIDKRFCTNCGNEFSNPSANKTESTEPQSIPNYTRAKFKSSWSASRILGTVIILGLIGWSIYNSKDDAVIEKK